MIKRFGSLLLTVLVILLAQGLTAFGQCRINVETLSRLSPEDLSVTVQGTASRDCGQITLHWINPPLPDRTITVNVNHSDPTSDNTWTARYESSDGLGLSMLLNNFACNSSNFEVQISCADGQQCQVNLPTDGLRVKCKEEVPICSILDIDLNCDPQSGNLIATAIVNNTVGFSTTVSLQVSTGSGASSTAQTDNDGFINPVILLPFATGTYTIVAEITAPDGCRTSRTETFNVDEDYCQGGGNDRPDDAGDDTSTTDEDCPTCDLCGGDIWCCVMWVLFLLAVMVIIGCLLYLLCSGGAAAGQIEFWIVLAITLAVAIFSIWFICEHCDFNWCTLVQVLIAAPVIDFLLICNVPIIAGLIPCAGPLCGVITIGGQAIITIPLLLAIIGGIIIFLLQLFCPG